MEVIQNIIILTYLKILHPDKILLLDYSKYIFIQAIFISNFNRNINCNH